MIETIVGIIIVIILLFIFLKKKPKQEKIVKSEEDIVYVDDLEFLDWVVSIWDWADLYEVSFQYIPRSESRLINLTRLDLSNHNLPYIPEEIANIKNLSSLDLSVNQLTEIPSKIYTMPSLTHLYLRNNQFTSIPSELTQSTTLIELDVSNNPLEELNNHQIKEDEDNELSVSLNNIIKSIDSLAPLSDAIVGVQKLYLEGQEELDISNFVKMIESDSLLSFNILKIANSPIYGFSTKITSISQAVTLFGSMQIYGFAMKYATANNIKAKTEIFECSNERFNDICNMQSAILFHWYSKVNLEEMKFLAPLALVIETGKLVIAAEVTSTSSGKEFKKGYRKARDVNEYEKKILGTTSYKLSSKVFEHWHLDPLYVNVLKGINNDEHINKEIEKYVQVLNIVVTAINLKSVLTKESIFKASILAKEMGLDPDTFTKVALKVKKDYMSELKMRQERTS